MGKSLVTTLFKKTCKYILKIYTLCVFLHSYVQSPKSRAQPKGTSRLPVSASLSSGTRNAPDAPLASALHTSKQCQAAGRVLVQHLGRRMRPSASTCLLAPLSHSRLRRGRRGVLGVMEGEGHNTGRPQSGTGSCQRQRRRRKAVCPTRGLWVRGTGDDGMGENWGQGW